MNEVKKIGQTDSEKDAVESHRARQIVKEIMDFGVSQRQIVKIIKLLSLEIEDRDLMSRLVKAVSETSDSSPVSTGKSTLSGCAGGNPSKLKIR